MAVITPTRRGGALQMRLFSQLSSHDWEGPSQAEKASLPKTHESSYSKGGVTHLATRVVRSPYPRSLAAGRSAGFWCFSLPCFPLSPLIHPLNSPLSLSVRLYQGLRLPATFATKETYWSERKGEKCGRERERGRASEGGREGGRRACYTTTFNWSPSSLLSASDLMHCKHQTLLFQFYIWNFH